MSTHPLLFLYTVLGSEQNILKTSPSRWLAPWTFDNGIFREFLFQNSRQRIFPGSSSIWQACEQCPRWVGEVWFSDNHAQALPSWAGPSAEATAGGWGGGVRRRDRGGAPFPGLCQHFGALPRVELVTQSKGKHSETFPGVDSQKTLFLLSTCSQSSVRTNWQWYEVNEPIKSSFVFQLLKLHAVIGSSDVCQGTSSQKLLPRNKFSSSKKNGTLTSKIIFFFKYLNI